MTNGRAQAAVSDRPAPPAASDLPAPPAASDRPAPPAACTATRPVGADRAELAHLLRRTGFGTTGAAVDAALAGGYQAAVAALLAPTGADPGAAATPAPDLGPEPAYPGKGATRQALMARNRLVHARVVAIELWWLDRMVAAQQPFTERLTFFWHGHWATSAAKVNDAQLLLQQNETLRRAGPGDFRALARAMVRDPALLIWLDGQQNTKKAPNENLGRELMELFTLGRGNYTEQDVREAARALTGWVVDRRTGAVAFRPGRHDDGSKTVLGQTGPLDDRSLVDLLVGQPASARFVATRLWQRFAAPDPPAADVLGRLVAGYGPGRDLTGLLRALFTDPAFRAAGNRHTLVKSPVEYVVGTLRALGLRVHRGTGTDPLRLLATLAALGQVPFYPPNVGGWPAGVGWLSTAATEARLVFAQRVALAADLSALGRAATRDRPDAVARLLGVDAWTRRSRNVLAGAADDPRHLVALALVTPEYVVA